MEGRGSDFHPGARVISWRFFQVPPVVGFREALRFWTKLGLISFGGPAGQIAIMEQELVERRGWVGQEQFLRALNFCMLLPGPEAQQLATYIGWRLHGLKGGVAAGVLFVLPSVFIIMGLSWLAAAKLEAPAVAGAFRGVQPVVVAVVGLAVVRIGQKSLRHWSLYLFPLAALTAIRWGGVPFPLVVAGAALAGVVLHHCWPRTSCLKGWDEEAEICLDQEPEARPEELPRRGYLVGTGLAFGALWAGPVALLILWRGLGDVLVREALFFTKAALVTFGGAYAVLSYIADFAVSQGWLTAQQMLIGLGLAESTPGPLIMVTQYVGFLGGWHLHGDLPPLAGGLLGGLITTYVTFLPCFFFIFLGSPFIEFLAGNPRLQAALGGVTAAVVGVVLNLGLFFAGKVLWRPGEGVDWFALVLAGAALVGLTRFKLPLHYLIPAGALAGIIRGLV